MASRVEGDQGHAAQPWTGGKRPERKQNLETREAALREQADELRRAAGRQRQRNHTQDQREHAQNRRSTLQDARQAAQDERDRLREMFVAAISHDLRNPLSAIGLTAATLLKRGTLGEKETEAMSRISRSADRMMHMIQQLLDFTRARLGDGISIERAPCDLEDIVRQVIAEAQTGAADRPFEVQTTPNPKGCWDRTRLQRLVSNLVGNAIEHGTPGTPIRVVLAGDAAHVALSVENQGPVIPGALLPAVFDPFRQARKSSGGVGLGLYIAQQIAQAHGGDIDVASSAAAGTRFTVRLPR